MGFMELQSSYGDWYVVEHDHGSSTTIPRDVAPSAATNAELVDYVPGRVDAPQETPAIVRGWAARYSAPGYLDCTEWVGVCASEAEALAECRSLYGEEKTE